ncbi:tyrosine-type recombinase/integrase [Pontibacillus yanchengensis]|uniref:tyrosine-type recombinase/integrase n=1 Tax=Pontibacillus yanchengensis TaxID=462910 RepID=UPI001F017E84|nr:tyrosine-type recombinase/integrase [Pontibacillus yanchengensis]
MEIQKEKYWQSSNEALSKETLEVLNEYLLSLKLANKAEATITKYRSVLERFFTDCALPIEEIASQDVLSWINEFTTDKKPKSVDLYLSTLSSFFQFCLEEDFIEHMIMKKRWRPKIPQSLPQYLTEREYAKVIIAAERLSLRDQSLVLFLFSSGCRRSEVANLKIEDVDMSRRTVKVRGKGSKIRHVHISEQCALILSDYLMTRSYEPTDPLFLGRYGGPLKSGGIYKVTTKLGRMVGLTKSLFPHCCRHTFATNMLAKGAELKFIADEMGHKDLNTTRVYARIPTEDMRIAYQNMMG